MCGDADAVKFIDDIAFWSHVYDDLIDPAMVPRGPALRQFLQQVVAKG
jgi:hypothetical protein